jgi:GNAT superfamily N-acetyltransferase
MIRFATAADTPIVARLIRALAADEGQGHTVIFDETQLREHLFGDRRYAEVLLAEDGGQVVGFILFSHTFSTYLGRPGILVDDWYVQPEFRGSGYARALIQEVARLAVERGCDRAEWTVDDWNLPINKLYRRLGATPVEEPTYILTGEALHRVAQGSSGVAALPDRSADEAHPH